MKVRTLILGALLLLPVAQPTLGAVPSADSDLCQLEAALLQAAPTLRPQALRGALSSWDSLRSRGKVGRRVLSVIDYSLPSTVERMWVFDMAAHQLLFHELVAHGKNSGDDLAQTFSNREGSLMTSLGAFVTGATYDGRHGYSLRLRGMQPELNDQAERRAIVVHGAPYVCEDVARQLGRLGRSHGCPAVRSEIARTLIDEIKGGSLLYAWHPSIQDTTPGGGLAATTTALAGAALSAPAH